MDTTHEQNTEVADRVDHVVSLRITRDTVLECRAECFTDGDNGTFMQKYKVFANDPKDHDTGVTVVVIGNTETKKTKRTFCVGSQEFYDVREALKAAGHDVVSSN